MVFEAGSYLSGTLFRLLTELRLGRLTNQYTYHPTESLLDSFVISKASIYSDLAAEMCQDWFASWYGLLN